MDHTIDLIAMTKAVGRALQQDERYIRYTWPNPTTTTTRPCRRPSGSSTASASI